MRNFQKIKEVQDYSHLDAPEQVEEKILTPVPKNESIMILRMLVRPKYGKFIIPESINYLGPLIKSLANYDLKRTGIKDSWCYVTIRHGQIKSITDDQFHFDGASFRTDIIPERNYIWVNRFPTEYKVGKLKIPDDFNPIRHNLFTFAEFQLKNNPILRCEPLKWYLLSPFCLHRRPILDKNIIRTFYRICFSDIEGRDVNNTPNPLLPTPFYGRNPVLTFRDNLKHYYSLDKGLKDDRIKI